MNYLGLLVLIAGVAVVAGHEQPRAVQGEPVDQEEWEAYKREFGKHYEDPVVDSIRRQLYAQSKRRVEEFNKAAPGGQRHFHLALNQFSDWSESEWSPGANKRRQPQPRGAQVSRRAREFVAKLLLEDGDQGPVPDELDWRQTAGRVSAVKTQGRCHAGWAFAVVGLLEGQERVHLNRSLEQVIELSAQNLIDCDPLDECLSGFLYDALNFVKKQGGIQAESSYPYAGKDGKCHYDPSQSVMSIVDATDLPFEDEERLKRVLARYGPVATEINARLDTFRHYKGGVYYDANCNGTQFDLNHGVLLVGYGTDNSSSGGGDYWLAKNSWGTSWGEQGYFRMARNRDDVCGIANQPYIAIF